MKSLVVLAIATMACHPDPASGVQVALETWRLSNEPALVIGGADEREGYLLHHVVGAVRLGDGRIVIANLSSLELKYYDPEGRHLFDAGGKGEGPGEFRSSISWCAFPGTRYSYSPGIRDSLESGPMAGTRVRVSVLCRRVGAAGLPRVRTTCFPTVRSCCATRLPPMPRRPVNRA